MFDANAIFTVVKSGGPDAIFLLLVFLGLLITGVIRPNATVDAELADRERAHQAELASRDRQITEITRLQERMTDRLDRQQQLFESALGLIRSDLLPMLKSRR